MLRFAAWANLPKPCASYRDRQSG
ncbi:hypothetical protein CU663_29155, partial [Pseudomonas syringae pv. actinidifoliorum]|nr:hypothetical protein [Pseudomonas syringae pv. actinidifoliorum]